MKQKLILFATIFVLLIASSCSVEPQKIAYGKDHCHYCDMTVVDKTHAAQYVTKKGKAYIFDSIECMINELQENQNEDNMAFILVSNYNNPGTLINASDATYLISKSIKSPMGANLSAFLKKENAEKIKIKSGGELYNWNQIKAKLSHK